MRIARFLVPALVLAAAGCILTSGQITASFDLPDPIVVDNPTQVRFLPVDLNTIGDYNDHKDKLKDIADLALLGEVHNNSTTAPIQVEFWMTTTFDTGDRTAAQVRASGILLWGPFEVAADASTRLDWDASAGLINDAGRKALLDEIRGTGADGQFTLYAIGPAGATTYNFSITDGVLVLVLDAGV